MSNSRQVKCDEYVGNERYKTGLNLQQDCNKYIDNPEYILTKSYPVFIKLH